MRRVNRCETVSPASNAIRMFKKALFFLLVLLFLTACASYREEKLPRQEILSTRSYLVTETILLHNQGEEKPEKQNLWVALIRDFSPYQHLKSRKISPTPNRLFTDEHGNEYAEFDFSAQPPHTKITVTVQSEVIVNELRYDLSDCRGELIQENISPELHIESANPQIIRLAESLSKNSACQTARAFYDYVGDTLHYTYNKNAWGAQATLGFMGSDCSEYASLTIALLRAKGIPARYFEGILYLDRQNGQLAHTQHAWLDLYLPGIGWTAVDPTLGRMKNNRDNYFAHYTPNHIIVTEGRNPSPLRGSSYLTHLYWPGNSTDIVIESLAWEISPLTK